MRICYRCHKNINVGNYCTTCAVNRFLEGLPLEGRDINKVTMKYGDYTLKCGHKIADNCECNEVYGG